MNLSIVRKSQRPQAFPGHKDIEVQADLPEDFCVPKGYQTGRPIVGLDEHHSPLTRFGSSFAVAELLRLEANLKYVVDLGCSYAEERSYLIKKDHYIGVGSGLKLVLMAEKLSGAQLICKNLNKKLEISEEILSQSVVVCDGTLEELMDPGPLLRSLAKIAHIAPYVLISGVDRSRVSPAAHLGPPTRKGVIREWNLTEFAALLRQSGIKGSLLGHTIYHGLHTDKIAMTLITGAHAAIASAPKKKVLSIVGCFNDADIIKQSIEHMLNEGLDVWVLDNWSSDGTWEILEAIQKQHPKRVVQIERFPVEGPDKEYSWQGILARKESIAFEQRNRFDWFIHHDSDEIRTSPWPGVTVADAISFIDHVGYNAINHLMVDFRPTQDGFDAPFHPKEYFSHFEFNTAPSAWMQTKGWASCDRKIDLLKWGGHEAMFENRKVCPLRFLLAHYSLRSKKQAYEKIFKHRLPRFGKAERDLGWHMHYDHYQGLEDIDILWRSDELISFSPSFFETEFLMERLIGINLKSPVTKRIHAKI